MDPNTLTPQQAFLLGILINAGVGLVIGLIPLILGFVKRNVKYGFYGFLASIIGGALLGILLSIPAAIIFSVMIVRNTKQPADVVAGNPPNRAVSNDRNN